MVLTEAALALAGFTVVLVIAAGVLGERRDARRGEERAAALETAQNLLARIRRDDPQPLPVGWSVQRRALGTGVVEVRVQGPGVALATLLAERQP